MDEVQKTGVYGFNSPSPEPLRIDSKTELITGILRLQMGETFPRCGG
jgi:hypothetical protein